MNIDGDTLRRTFDAYEAKMPLNGDLAEGVKSRVRADRRKRQATWGGVTCALLLVGAAWVLQTRLTVSSDAPAEPVGKVVGERLGLEPVPFPGDGCQQWAGYEHDWGYCLDDVTDNEADLVLLSQEIYGYDMTDARIAYVNAVVELEDYRNPQTDEDKAKVRELEAIRDEARPQLDALYDPINVDDFPGLTGEALADAAGLIPSKGIPFIGVGSWNIEIGQVVYDLDGVYQSESDGREWASRLSGHDLRTAVVPDVVGLAEEEALTLAREAGFTPEVERTYSDEPAGVVHYQFPRAGVEQMVDMPFHLVISKGPLPTTPPPGATAITMPDLVGLKNREAEQIVHQLDLYGPFQKATVAGTADTVIDQEPEAGTTVYAAVGDFPGTMVKLWLGK